MPFALKRDQILFAAFDSWDAAGAKSFGYPTYWVNQQNQPAEELGVAADAVGGNLHDLLSYLAARGTEHHPRHAQKQGRHDTGFGFN